MECAPRWEVSTGESAARPRAKLHSFCVWSSCFSQQQLLRAISSSHLPARRTSSWSYTAQVRGRGRVRVAENKSGQRNLSRKSMSSKKNRIPVTLITNRPIGNVSIGPYRVPEWPDGFLFRSKDTITVRFLSARSPWGMLIAVLLIFSTRWSSELPNYSPHINRNFVLTTFQRSPIVQANQPWRCWHFRWF